MTLKSLITTLVLGASTIGAASTASAAPIRHEAARTSIRDHREPVRVERSRAQPARFDRDHDRNRWQRRDRDDDRRFVRPILQRPIVRERFYDRPVYSTTYVQPVTMSASPFVNGQMFVGLGGAAGGAVELSSNGGSTFVQQILIQYTDGRTQAVSVGQYIDAGNPAIDVPTDGSPVSGVVIYGQGTGVSAFAV